MRKVVGMVGGCPARAFGSTCLPGDEVRGSGRVDVSCGPCTALWSLGGESGVGMWWESVRIGSVCGCDEACPTMWWRPWGKGHVSRGRRGDGGGGDQQRSSHSPGPARR